MPIGNQKLTSDQQPLDQWRRIALDYSTTTFGDQVTCDTMVIGDERDNSFNGDRCAHLIKDRATKWLQCYPRKHKKTEDWIVAFQKYFGPNI